MPPCSLSDAGGRICGDTSGTDHVFHNEPQAVAREVFEVAKIMSFEWDAKKAIANRRKHGVTFEEASSALRDRLSATGHDPDHSENEERFVTFGMSSQGRLLAVSHTDRGNTIRIISARLATSAERQIYEEG
jgi:uncharacterized DUF497 family protein